MTKVLVCIIVGLASLAAYNTMAVEEGHAPAPMCGAVHIANRESKLEQCLDFNVPPLLKGSNHDDDVLAQLAPCTNERQNQFWSLSKEGYIRSRGNKCLIYDPFVNQKNPVTVKDCDKSREEAKIWKFWPDGTISHVVTPYQVLTASFAVPHPFVNLEQNTHGPSQTWAILLI